jgi:uncharacterized protein YbaP (TraB family)
MGFRNFNIPQNVAAVGDHLTMQPFEDWGTELEAALETERTELAAAETEHENALFAVRSANNEKAVIGRAFAKLAPWQVSGHLVVRRRGYEQQLDAATITLARLTNQISGHRKKIQEFEQALEQLNQISPQPDDDASDEAA